MTIKVFINERELDLHLASFSPSIVIDGVNLPLLPNNDSPSGLANSSLGFGSQRLPSTRDHTPIEQFHPMILYKIQQ